jgi:two-component system chemotaxis response regulator CheY
MDAGTLTAAQPTPAKKTVMLVEDSSHFRVITAQALQRAGYEVLQAADGQQAWSLLAAGGRHIDVIVTDLNMPNMDGLDFARRVKASGSHRFVPILMLTTESQVAKKAEGKAAGVKAWMVKPFQPQQLLDALQKLCP